MEGGRVDLESTPRAVGTVAMLRALPATPGPAERASILLDVTNAFLACSDLDDLGRTINEALARLFEPDKSNVSLRDANGAMRLLAADGFADREVEEIRAALREGNRTLEEVLGGQELWSSDPADDLFRQRLARYDARSGFALPIVTPAGVVGTCAGLYREEREFDEAFRTAARSVVAQAGLMIRLFASRDDARRALADTERRQRGSEMLLKLSSALAEMQDVDEIARIVCRFVARASDAPFAMVGRRAPTGDAFAIAATEGLDDGQIERIARALDQPDRPSLRDLLAGLSTARQGEAAVGAGIGIERAMGVPIVWDNRTAGFIAIGAPRSVAIADDDWPELLTAFAALTATALARAEAVTALADHRDLLASEVEERTRNLRTAVQELRIASDAKTDFLANVSHELRTPLTAILGFAEMLADGADGGLNEDQARDLGTIQRSSRHLLELIDDLIAIASIEAGRVSLSLERVDLPPLVRECVEAVRPLAAARRIKVAVSGAVEPRVDADRGRVRDIVLNLLSNALKFTPAGGSVQVELGVERDAGRADGADSDEPDSSASRATVAVRDSGIGIAAADHDRIFEKFVRIAGPAVPGTGLGLAIARDLARLHGGDITLDSALERGSTFVLRLPIAAPG
jgi:signal transduction histidine kinase